MRVDSQTPLDYCTVAAHNISFYALGCNVLTERVQEACVTMEYNILIHMITYAHNHTDQHIPATSIPMITTKR